MSSMGHTAAGLAKSLAGSQSRGGMVAMLPGGIPSSMLGDLASIVKPGRVVLTVLVGVVEAWGPSKAHLMAGI